MSFGLPLFYATALFLAFDLTELDVVISNYLYDPVAHVFAFQHSRLFENITHRWARIIPDWTGEAALLGALFSYIWPRFNAERDARLIAFLEQIKVAPLLRFLTRHRKDFIYVVVAFSICTGAIHYFKSHTNVYCPVETTLYGGSIEKKEWFENFDLLHKAGDGRCWPGGHASGGFTLLALYFVARRYRWRYTKPLFYGALALGFIYGTTRVLQGWHFMSHTFWAAIVVWFSAMLTALAFYGRHQLQDPRVNRP